MKNSNPLFSEVSLGDLDDPGDLDDLGDLNDLGDDFRDRLEGSVTVEREDGSWREGFCVSGRWGRSVNICVRGDMECRWEGMVREFDWERKVVFIGRFQGGRPWGCCWLRRIGGELKPVGV